MVQKGNVTHVDETIPVYTREGNAVTGNAIYWFSQDYYVNRALYIGNTFYTVYNAKVLLNSLDNMTLIAEVNLR